MRGCVVRWRPLGKSAVGQGNCWPNGTLVIYQFLKCYVSAKAGINCGLLLGALGKRGAISVSVRILMGIILAAVTGGAQASSLVFPGAPSSTPSIVRVGAPNRPKIAEEPTPSMSVGAGIGAASPTSPMKRWRRSPTRRGRHGFMPGPMIIRGGVVGADFPALAPRHRHRPRPPPAAPAEAPAHGRSDPGRREEAGRPGTCTDRARPRVGKVK